ncbi:SGNH/GDSL hydrolase family protein [Tomitella gaofuii]|uniref:SGNH/GDSL hydrolase family protein n=1 Tax=Tomitella gaofuii TaxID=2760083 RepID=UPI0015FDDAF4|nr:GDSL-type esterase/lipase family protein [Tomitella gaofuii]
MIGGTATRRHEHGSAPHTAHGAGTQVRRAAITVVVGALVAAGTFLTAGPASAAPETTYYVSLGDSLSTGYQPDSDTDEPIAYSDRIFAALSADEPGLELRKFGCDGETSVSMVEGGHCSRYQQQSQLDAAAEFIEAHPGQIAYVTNDIGANDIFPCVSGGAGGGGSLSPSSGSAGSGSAGASVLPMAGCVAEKLGVIRTNLARIDARIRNAGGDGPVYVGMTYYNPMLAAWLQGGMQRALAAATVPADNLLSAVITSTNARYGWRTADVTAAFDTNDFTGDIALPGAGTVPTNVARICTWTWMCSLGDIHANPAGHQVIADTFLPLLTGENGADGSLGSAGSVADGPSGSSGSLGSVRALTGMGGS